MKSAVTLNRDGSLDLVLANQMQLSEAERGELAELERQLASIIVAEGEFRREIERLEIKLMSNSEYVELLRLRGKLKLLRELKSKQQLLLDARYEAVFRRNGLSSSNVTEIIGNLLPEPDIYKKKRGRPKKGGVL